MVDYLNVSLRSRYSGLADDTAVRYYNSNHSAGNYRITIDGVQKCLNKIIASKNANDNTFNKISAIFNEKDAQALLEICTHQYPMLDSVASYSQLARNVLLHLEPEHRFYSSILKSIKQQLEENVITDNRLTKLIVDCADGDLSYFIMPTGFQLLLDGSSCVNLTGANFTQDQIKYTVKIDFNELNNKDVLINLSGQVNNIVSTLQTIDNNHPDKNKLVMAFVGHIMSQNPQHLDSNVIYNPFEGLCLGLLKLLQPLLDNFYFRTRELSNPEELRNFVIMANFLIRFYSAQGETGLQHIKLLLEHTLPYRLREDNAGYILLIYNCQKIQHKGVNELALTHYSAYLQSADVATITTYCCNVLYCEDSIHNVYYLIKKDPQCPKSTIAIVVDSEYLCDVVFRNIFKFSQEAIKTRNSCYAFEKVNEADNFVMLTDAALNNLPQVLDCFPLLKYIIISNDRIISFLKLLNLGSFGGLFINAVQLSKYNGNLCEDSETRIQLEAIFRSLLIQQRKVYSLKPDFLQQVEGCYSTKEPRILAQVYLCLAATLTNYNSSTFFGTCSDSINSLRIVVSRFLKKAVELDGSIFKGQTVNLENYSLSYFVGKLEGDECLDGVYAELLKICLNKCKDKIDGRWIIDETIPSAWR